MHRKKDRMGQREAKIVSLEDLVPQGHLLRKIEATNDFEFIYDEYYDCILCPAHQLLKYSTTNRDGYREYKSNPAICRECPKRVQCTHSKSCQKVVTRHIWEPYMEMAEDYRYTPQYKAIYGLRKETIERVFGDAKEKHGMRYTQLRGLLKVGMQAALTFTCMNLKKLARWGHRAERFLRFSYLFFVTFSLYLKKGAHAAA